MTQHDNRAEARLPTWVGGTATLETPPLELPEAAAPRAQVTTDAGAAIVRQFNGPVTALLLYMNELKQHSHQFAHAPGNGVYLRQVIENALEQTERVSAMLKQISDLYPSAIPAAERNGSNPARAWMARPRASSTCSPPSTTARL